MTLRKTLVRRVLTATAPAFGTALTVGKSFGVVCGKSDDPCAASVRQALGDGALVTPLPV